MLFIGLSMLGLVSYATMTWYPTMFVRSFGEPVSRVGLVFGPLSLRHFPETRERRASVVMAQADPA